MIWVGDGLAAKRPRGGGEEDRRAWRPDPGNIEFRHGPFSLSGGAAAATDIATRPATASANPEWLGQRGSEPPAANACDREASTRYKPAMAHGSGNDDPDARWAGIAGVALAGRRRVAALVLLFLGSFGVYMSTGHFNGAGDTVPASLMPITLALHGTVSMDYFAEAKRWKGKLPYYLAETPNGVGSSLPMACRARRRTMPGSSPRCFCMESATS